MRSNSNRSGFVSLPLNSGLSSGLLHDCQEGDYRTAVYGLNSGQQTLLPINSTHFGVLVSGEAELITQGHARTVYAGEYFSVAGLATINSLGAGMVTSAYGYHGMNMIGGSLEKEGRLKYINSCTDSLIIPPPKRGDPCLNHLHFPKYVSQTDHTHPDVRVGMVVRGKGVCKLEGGEVPLIPGYAFIMQAETLHSFYTKRSTMDIVVFHPTTDFGPTDEDHPMLNRTIVEGVSANQLEGIRTK